MRAGLWPIEQLVATATLPFDSRYRRRVLLADDSGAEFLLDLERAQALEEGDGLRLEAGGWIRVTAAPESVVDIRAADAAGLARIAWHLGNRHLPVQVIARGLRIRRDHVIEDMLRGLGAEIEPREAPFQPERGAYGGHAH
jgi:urease accessory protein